MSTPAPPEPNPFGGALGQDGTDAGFILICSFIVFTMQSGFGLVESGLVSRKSEANIMVKNMVDVVLGGIAYWLVGFGFSFGENTKGSGTMSGEGYFATDVNISSAKEAHAYTKYFFHFSYATTATTIVSGAVAERCKFRSYMVFTFIMTGLIYVFPAHWMWHPNGWLYGKANDYAGSGVVHMSGGAAAFAGCIMLGARYGRYDKHRSKKVFSMASPTNVILGTFFLWWGWIGFNCGSHGSITGDSGRVVSRVAVVTMNGAVAGGVGIIFVNLIAFRHRKYTLNIREFATGVLGGLVSITAGSNQIWAWEGMLIGFIGGLIANGFNKILDKLEIDDPVGCIGIHWAAGFWGMIATGLFGMNKGVFRGHGGKMLGYNIAACVVITLWSGGLSFIVFGFLHYVKAIGLRMSEMDEAKGSDKVEHDIMDEVYDKISSYGKKMSQISSGFPNNLPADRIASTPSLSYRETKELSTSRLNTFPLIAEAGTM